MVEPPRGQHGSRDPVAEPLMAGADQPVRRSFGLAGRPLGPEGAPCVETELARDPFWRLLEFRAEDGAARPALLLVAPLSGHFAFLARELAAELAAGFRVLVADWANPRHVPVSAGVFDLDANLAAVLRMMRAAGPGAACVGLCQGGVAALAAAALLAAEGDPATPEALALIAAPIDPRAAPTRIATMLAASSEAWFRAAAAREVGAAHAGRGRAVYPAELQLAAFRMYLMREAAAGGEMTRKLLRDDGSEPERFPFLDLYTSVMDLDLAFVLEHTASVFRRRELARGRMSWRGRPVEPAALTRTGLVTLGGGRDRVAAPAQTEAALALCRGVPAARRRRLRFDDLGHFSLFHGESCRRMAGPALRRACLELLG